MNPLLSRRRVLQLLGSASVTLGVASTAAVADTEPADDVRTISVNGQAFTGYWASQQDTPRGAGGQ